MLNLSGWRERGFYGRAHRNKAEITAEDLRRRLSITLDHEVEVLEHQFARNNVAWVSGAARFLGPHAVEATGEHGEVRHYHGDHNRPSHIPFDGENVVDADELTERLAARG